MATQDFLEIILDSIPPEFLISAEEEFRLVYRQVHQSAAKEMADRPLYSRYLGHNRHFLRQEAYRRSAESCGLSWRSIRSNGYPLGLIETGGLLMLEAKIDAWGGFPKESDNNKLLARHNPFQGRSSLQLELTGFSAAQHKLLAFLLVASSSDAEPTELGIGIPNANLDDWVELRTFDELLRAHTDKTQQRTCTDKAMPKLGGRRQKAESERHDEDGG